MQDRLESILIDLYYSTIDGDWSLLKLTTKEKRAIEDYVITRVFNDPLGKASVYYRLSPAGEVIAEFVLRKYGRDTSSGFGGLVLEKRTWLVPQRHNIPTTKLVDAFKQIAKRGQIPVEIRTDWHKGRKRIVFRDLDRGLSRISYDIEWETNKHLGEQYLVHVAKFHQVAAWLWLEVLDPHRKEIRSCHFQQEFIVWDG